MHHRRTRPWHRHHILPPRVAVCRRSRTETGTDKRLDHFYQINPFHACLPPQVLEVLEAVPALEVLGAPEVLEVALVVVVPAPACHNNPDRVAP